MPFKKILFFLFISFIFSSCVLIQESKNKKRLANVEYEKVYKEDNDTFEISEQIKETQVVKEKGNSVAIETIFVKMLFN